MSVDADGVPVDVVQMAQEFSVILLEALQRAKVTEEVLERLCSYSRTTEVWFALWQGDGAYGFNELCRFVGCSPTTLSECLSDLLADDLVRMVGRKYQVAVPPWMRNGT